MNSTIYRFTSRSGLSKAILVIRKETICFKEGLQLFGDDSLIASETSEVIAVGR